MASSKGKAPGVDEADELDQWFNGAKNAVFNVLYVQSPQKRAGGDRALSDEMRM